MNGTHPALALFARLTGLGVRLAVRGDRLEVRAPAGTLDADGLQADVRANKRALMALAAVRGDQPPRCVRCGRVAWPEYGAERVAGGGWVCGDDVTAADVAAGSVPVLAGGSDDALQKP